MINKFTKSIFNKIKNSFVTFVVWDFDGTLYQSDELAEYLKAGYIKFANQRGEKISEEEFDHLSEKLGRWSATASKLTETPEIEIINEVEKKYDKAQHLTSNPKLVASVERLDNYRHLILTNSTKIQVERGLVVIGFKPKRGMDFFPFEKIFARDTTHTLKPSSQNFEMVANYTQKPKLRHLMIGDSHFEDIDPAKKIGFQSAHIDNITDIFPGFNST